MYLTPKEYIEDFLIKFWNECYCSRKCFSRVKISNALEIHQKYADMFLEEKNSSIGALLLNMVSESNDRRNKGEKQQYCCSLGGIAICKNFFLFLHSISKKQIERLQKCINNDDSFENKKKREQQVSF